MHFTNPMLLWALTAAAAPILIHLLSRRRTRLVPFPSLRWILASSRTAMRRVQLRSWLQLLIRTLTVAAVVMALTGPWVPARDTALDRGPARIMIVIDDSSSMAAAPGLEPFIQRARERAVEIAARFDADGDRVYLHRTSGGEAERFEPLATGQVRERIAALEPWPGEPAPKAPVLDRAAEFAAHDPERARANAALFYITDLQAADAPASWPHAAPVIVVDVGEDYDNAWIECGLLPSRPLRLGSPVTWDYAVAASNAPDAGLAVDFFLNEIKTATESARPGPGSRFESGFTAVPPGPGVHRLRIRIEDDPFAADNSCHGVVVVREPIAVLAATESDSIEARLLAAALSPPETEGAFEVTITDPTELARVGTGAYDLVAVPVLTSGLMGSAPALLDYARQGGGVMIFPGPDLEPEAFNRALGAALGVLAAEPQGNPGAESFHTPLPALPPHPALRGLESAADLESLRYNIHIPLEVTNPDAQVALTGPDGSPLGVEVPVGRGRIMVFAVPLSWSAGQWPASPVFVALTMNAAAHLAGGSSPMDRSLEPGEHPTRALAAADEIDSARWTGPDSSSGVAFPVRESGRTMLVFPPARAPGIYEVELLSGGEPVGADAYAVNAPRLESDPKRLDPAEAEKAGQDLRVWDGRSELGARLEPLRGGVWIGGWFAAAALVLFMLDLIISNAAAYRDTEPGDEGAEP